jgi:hypothetical protein
MIAGISLSYIIPIMFRHVPSIPTFSDLLSWKDVEFSQRLFCIYWDDNVIFFFNCVYVLYYIYCFAYVDLSLHLWNETNLIMAYDLFNVSLDLVFKYIIANFLQLCSWGKLACNFFFASLPSFGIRVMLDLLNDFNSVPSLCIFWI